MKSRSTSYRELSEGVSKQLAQLQGTINELEFNEKTKLWYIEQLEQRIRDWEIWWKKVKQEYVGVTANFEINTYCLFSELERKLPVPRPLGKKGEE